MSPQVELEAGPSDAGSRLDIFLAKSVRSLTRSRVQRFIAEGRALVNGREGKAGYRLRNGDRVSWAWEEMSEDVLRPEDLPLEILYADEHLAVINKPTGVVVHPGAGHRKGTLAAGLLAAFPELESIGPGDRPGIVHRLDKETSGVMLVARTAEAFFSLQRMFKNRKVHKTYLGLVWGRMSRPEGRMVWAIGRSAKNGGAFSVRGRNPREALTLYKVVREFKDYSLLEIQPVTGRTHQIRVHLAAAGHPLAGDSRYGRRRKGTDVPRQFLHAWRISFLHPHTGQEVEFTAPLPLDLEETLSRLAPSSRA